jgi:hypothetical protein
METTTYRRACVLRHPQFRDDLRKFYQTFPPLLRLKPPATAHLPLDAFPPWIRPFVEVSDAIHIKFVPRTFDDIPPIMGQRRMLPPRDGSVPNDAMPRAHYRNLLLGGGGPSTSPR